MSSRNPKQILDALKQLIDGNPVPRDRSEQLEVSFGDASIWLHLRRTVEEGYDEETDRGNEYHQGKIAGWLEALSYVQGKSLAETKPYLMKIGLFTYEGKDADK